MVMLLNYSWLILLAVLSYIGHRKGWLKTWNKKAAGLLVAFIVGLVIINSLTAHYLPKPGTPEPLANPAFEQTDAVIEDRLSKPSPDIDARYEEKFDAVRQATEQ